MNREINVGIIGATGMVGQNYVRLLEEHPWFRVSYVAASPRSAGKSYAEAVAGRWRQEGALPERVAKLTVHDAFEVPTPGTDCDLIFSAISLDKAETRRIEETYAEAGFPVVSNNSAHRTTPDVPMIIPEVNPSHLDILPIQQRNHGWKSGFIVTKPNCGVQSYVVPLAALLEAGVEVGRLLTTNLQALSGAGYPGVASLDVTDNLAHLPSEEEKALVEPAKMLGSVGSDRIIPREGLAIASHCLRVPVVHGHSSTVSFSVENGAPTPQEIAAIFHAYRPLPQQLGLPTAPDPVLRLHEDPSRPQPRIDRDAGAGMAISVGRIARCPILGYRFFCLSHNTVRGAAGGAILGAELLTEKGYIR